MDFGLALGAMNWTNILEGIISGLVSILCSTAIVWFVTRLIPAKRKKSGADDVPKEPYFSPFALSLFATSFFGILSGLSLVFYPESSYFAGFVSLAMFLGIITFLIYDNQCPNCYRIFKKKLTRKETINDEEREYRYRDCTVYLYTDGSEKDRVYSGEEKVRTETWRTWKEFYECQACGHRWDKIFERNLDADNRPKPNIIRTKVDPPIKV